MLSWPPSKNIYSVRVHCINEVQTINNQPSYDVTGENVRVKFSFNMWVYIQGHYNNYSMVSLLTNAKCFPMQERWPRPNGQQTKELGLMVN